jgi:hypothetical protein
MQVLHLGHQGWSIATSSGQTKILVDYVERNMGHGSIVLPKYPNPQLTLDLSSYQAILVSHEHADHFEIETLVKIYQANPKIVACVPDLSSRALPAILETIGYRVIQYSAFQRILIGDLEVTALPCDYSRLEPDLYGLLFKDRSNSATFLTSIDGILSRQAIVYVGRTAPTRSLDNFTNNYVVRCSAQHGLAVEAADQHRSFMQDVFATYCDELNVQRVVLSGLGWCYPPPFEALNKIMFPIKHDQLADHAADGTLKFVHPCALGDTFELTADDARLVSRQAERIADVRAFGSGRWPETSLDGFASLDDAAMSRLQAWIQGELGRLVGTGVKKLCEACHDLRSEGESNAFVLAIRHAKQNIAYRFDFARLEFAALNDEPCSVDDLQRRYAMGLIVPAEVLDAIRTGRDEAHICFEVACITWNARWDLLPECADVDIAASLHPRYRSELYDRQYRSVLARCAAASC